MGSGPIGAGARKPHNLMSKSWEPYSFTKVPERPQTSTYNILWIRGKGPKFPFILFK